MSENVLSVFSSRSIMVSCLMFMSLSHLSLFLCMLQGCVLTLLIYMWQNHLLKRLSPFILLPLCQRLIDCMCGFISGLCYVPLIYMSVFAPVPHCFDYCSFIVLLILQYQSTPSRSLGGFAFCFVFFPQECSGSCGLLQLYT